MPRGAFRCNGIFASNFEAEAPRLAEAVETEGTPDDVLALAERVYDGLSEEEIDEVGRISLDRRTSFANRTS